MNPFDKVHEFERVVADYSGAPYSIATDCCSHAIFLSAIYYKQKHGACTVTMPKNTYVSAPMQMIHAGFDVEFTGDYDDPTYNEMQSFGDRIPLAFEFDPLNQWNDLYELPEFLDYMPANKNNNRIPVGNISNEVDDIDYILKHDKIDKVTYNESI